MGALERTVLVGTDFSEASDHAILEGLERLMSGTATTLHIFHVLDPRDVIDSPERRALETEVEVLSRAPGLLRRRVEALAAREALAFDPSRLQTHARIGSAVDTLLQACVDYDADLLIVGTHGRKGVERFLLGSAAEALVRKARCPVLIARAKDYTGLEKTPLPDPPYAPGQEPVRPDVPDEEARVTSTTRDSWHPSDNGPTGFRIV